MILSAFPAAIVVTFASRAPLVCPLLISTQPRCQHQMHRCSKSEKGIQDEIREMRTEELKSILATITKHIRSLIEGAENRARAGDSPCPTARGGLDRVSNSPSSASSGSLTATSLEPSESDCPMQEACRPDELHVGNSPFVAARTGLLRGVPRMKLASSAKAGSSTDTRRGTVRERPIRTRVLRRASSIRQLFLGGARSGGDRLVHFAEQMGLPHQLVVEHVQVRGVN